MFFDDRRGLVARRHPEIWMNRFHVFTKESRAPRPNKRPLSGPPDNPRGLHGVAQVNKDE